MARFRRRMRRFRRVFGLSTSSRRRRLRLGTSARRVYRRRR